MHRAITQPILAAKPAPEPMAQVNP